MKKVEPILDRMIQAGWATSYVTDTDYFSVDWTELGHKRMKYLSMSFYELYPVPSAKEDYADLWGLVTIYGHFHPATEPGPGEVQ